jgi:salicylate hydroxylase
VIIAADGIKSKIRKEMLALRGEVDKVRETGDAAWRATASGEQIYARKDPELIELLDFDGWVPMHI